MADPIFGISIRKVDESARPVLAADLSTIGISVLRRLPIP